MRLFVYGTLQSREVMELVAGRDFPARPAVLDGYQRARVRRLPYPGIARRAGASTEGLLYAGLDAPTLARIDRFEGELYERRQVRVRAGTEILAADTYIVPDARREVLTDEAWDLEGVSPYEFASLVQSCRAFHRAEGGSAG